MRISTDKDDPGYALFTRGIGWRVWLAGSERKHVITADEDKRYAVTLKLGWPGIPDHPRR